MEKMSFNIEKKSKGIKIWDILKKEFINQKQEPNKNQLTHSKKKFKNPNIIVKKPNFKKDNILLFTENNIHCPKKKHPKEITRIIPEMREDFYHMFSIYRINHNFNIFENEQKNIYTNDKLNSLFYNLYKNDKNFLINRAKNDPFLHEKETTRIFTQFARNKSKNFNFKCDDRIKLSHKLLNQNLRDYAESQNFNNIIKEKENGLFRDDEEYVLYNLFKNLNSKYNFYKNKNNKDDQLYQFLSEQFEEYNKMNSVSCGNKKINKTIYRIKLRENNDIMHSYKYKDESNIMNNISKNKGKNFKVKNNKSYNSSMYNYTKNIIENLKNYGENIKNIDDNNKYLNPITPNKKNQKIYLSSKYINTSN